MADVELLGLYWTVSGPVEVHVGREWSLFDWRDRCAQAARVGFAGLGIWHADLEHQLEARDLREIKAIFDDAGLRHLELEFLMDWFLPADDERRVAADASRRLILEAASVLEPHHIKIGNIPGTPCEFDRLTEGFAGLCADAAEHTAASVAYEIMPFDVNVPDVATGVALVENAGAANGGLAIDTWHMSKLGIPPADIARLAAGRVAWVELSDGQVEDSPDLVDETINHRRLPGEGEFDIPAYVEACREAGYPGPWGVEVLSEELRNRPMEEIFQRAHDTTAAQFRAGVA